jgi:hypothetical protein
MTENGRVALQRAFDEEYTADPRADNIYRGFWIIERSPDGAVFQFRRMGLAALAAAQFTTPGKLRRRYENDMTSFLAQFHDMMVSCGAVPSDYDLEVIWNG